MAGVPIAGCRDRRTEVAGPAHPSREVIRAAVPLLVAAWALLACAGQAWGVCINPPGTCTKGGVVYSGARCYFVRDAFGNRNELCPTYEQDAYNCLTGERENLVPGIGVCDWAGSCQGTMSQCGAATSSCHPESHCLPPGVPPCEEICNGLDDNCNHQIDEGDVCKNEFRLKPRCEAGLLIGDPFSLAGGSTSETFTDLRIDTARGALELKRYFVSSAKATGAEFDENGTNLLAGTPVPFGSAQSVPTYASVYWWHSLHAFVFEGRTVAVWTPAGSILNFEPFDCTSPGTYWAAAAGASQGIPERLQVECGTAGAKTYVLHEGDRRYRFSARWSDTGYSDKYYLTAVENGHGEAIATMTYGTPGYQTSGQTVSCPNCTAAGNCSSGTPYLREVTVANGSVLEFTYKALERAPGVVECVVDRVKLGTEGSASRATVLAFSYAQVGGVEAPGRLAYAYFGEPGQARRVQVIEHGSTSFKVISQVGASQHVEVQHTYSNGRLATSVADGENLEVRWDPVTWDPVGLQHRVTDRTAEDGYGTAVNPVTTFEVTTDPDEVGSRVGWASTECSSSAGCVSGFEYRAGSRVANAMAFCDRGGRCDVTEYTQPSPTDEPQLRYPSRILRGAPNETGNDAIEQVDLTYVLHAGTHEPSEVTEERPSLVGTGTAYTKTWHDADGRVTKVIRSGFTYPVESYSPTWVPARLYIGTFYSRSGGTLGISGPCYVSREAATGCEGAAFPLREIEYWPESDPPPRRGQVKEIRDYPDNSRKAPLVRKFKSYDALGNVLEEEDANGNVITYSHVPGTRLLASRQVGTERTEYGYENDELTWVKHPAGNYEVFCRRTGTGSDGCVGGTWASRVQWRATAADAAGVQWFEKVKLAYQADGALKEEAFYSRCAPGATCGADGELRRVLKYGSTADGVVRRGFGGSPGAIASRYETATRFDDAGNIAAIGAAYNDPPRFCQDTYGDSEECRYLEHDGLQRLTSVLERPTVNETSQSCFAYDAHGNIAKVLSGCVVEGCDFDSLPPECADLVADYRHDDFGRLIDATLPGSRAPDGTRGKVRYAHDAAGNLVFKDTESSRASAPGYWYRYVRDQLGRLLDAQYRSSGGVNGMYSLYYDDDGPSPDASCPQPANTRGRVRMVFDNFGKTWFRYDAEGRVLEEIRDRDYWGSACTVPASAGTADNTHPNTNYTYTANGRVQTIVYPHGRKVEYRYYADDKDRVEKVIVHTWDGSTWTAREILSGARWEPYGPLRSYTLHAPLATAPDDQTLVEYLHGASSTKPTLSCGVDPSLEADDASGRLRGLWMTRGTGTRGDLFKQTYTWKADQLVAQDTCLLSSTGTPRREEYGYDRMLRLREATRPSGNFAAAGGAFIARRYTLDTRGNLRPSASDPARLDDFVDANAPGFEYEALFDAGSDADRLVGFGSSRQGSDLRTVYESDALGRVVQKRWPEDSSNKPAHSIDFLFDWGYGGMAGSESVYHAASVDDGFYGYYYDYRDRRRLKSYPMGARDEFFYDQGHQMLEDRGSAWPWRTEPYSIDEYVWLDDRPIAFVRSGFDSGWNRQPDLTGSCQRNAESTPCGIYFIGTDPIGKPVVVLDANNRVAGAADYDPFGYPNRVTLHAETEHPYPPETAGVSELARFTQRRAAAEVVDVRVRFESVDTEYYPAQDVMTDYVSFRDSSGSHLSYQWLGGHHRGPMQSEWFRVPQPPLAPTVVVRFTTDGKNLCPLEEGGRVAQSNCPFCPEGQAGCGYAPGRYFGYRGVTMSGYEYRRYEQAAGVEPVWTPLRFPGQYHDAETDLFENWHRYYDPSIGRYLSPEPLLQKPKMLVSYAQRGINLNANAYAANNPLAYFDPNGLSPQGPCGLIGGEQACLDEAKHLCEDWARCKEQCGEPRLNLDTISNGGLADGEILILGVDCGDSWSSNHPTDWNSWQSVMSTGACG